MSDTLSPRGKAVLLLVGEGKSNKEIGEQLYISEATVKRNISSAISKLGANDRTNALILALKRGLIILDEINT